MPEPTDHSRYIRPKVKNGRWWIRCGYVEVEQAERLTSFARKDHYFGRIEEVDETYAIAAAVQRQMDWEKVEEETRQKNHRLRTLGLPPVKAVWPKQEVKQVEIVSTPAKAEDLTLLDAKDRYFDSRKKEVGLERGQGIEESTYNGIRATLLLSMGKSSSLNEQDSIDTGRIPIDLMKRLSQLKHDDIETFVQFWKAPGRLGSLRTAMNYCNAFKTFLEWCQTKRLGLQPGFSDEVKPIFRFKRRRKIKTKKSIVPFDAVKVNEVLKTCYASSEKAALFILLALNCGYYQGDIGQLKHEELVIHNGDPCLWRARSKSEHQHEEDEMETLHWLFPETYALLRKYMAPKDNPYGLLLLNERGSPLWSESLGKYRKDAISRAYARVCKKIRHDILVNALAAGMTKENAMQEVKSNVWTFRQWRKFGWNATKRLAKGMNPTSRLLVMEDAADMARLYSGQVIEGVSKVYNIDDFDDLTIVLKKWHQELLSTAVLARMVHNSPKAF